MRLQIFVLIITLGFAGAASADSGGLADLKHQAFHAFRAGQYQRAVDFTAEALAIARTTYGPDSLQSAEFLGNLGALQRHLGEENKGEALLDEARDIREARGVDRPPVGIETELYFAEAVEIKNIVAARLIQQEELEQEQKTAREGRQRSAPGADPIEHKFAAPPEWDY